MLTQHRHQGRHHHPMPGRSRVRRRRALLIALVGVVATVIAVGSVDVLNAGRIAHAVHRPGLTKGTSLPTGGSGSAGAQASYLGLYVSGVPLSYDGLTSFTRATGVSPNLVSYYSGWFEPFSTSFATLAAKHDAVPLVQINPKDISITAIASGTYDGYLKSYAEAVRSHHGPVILSFGHEMNGQWYPWGYKHTPARVFVAAWRHIVQLFQGVGADNVTWMWTVNTIWKKGNQIPNPSAWWPGSRYVNWVGIDGYFHNSAAQFSSVFGPTIADVRELTHDPILISETGAGPDTNQSAKIDSLFRGVQLYGLLGFIWFDAIGNTDDRVDTRASMAAFRRGAKAYGIS